MDEKIGAVKLEVDGLERIQAALDSLEKHLQAAQAIINDLEVVEIDVRVAATSDGIPVRT